MQVWLARVQPMPSEAGLIFMKIKPDTNNESLRKAETKGSEWHDLIHGHYTYDDDHNKVYFDKEPQRYLLLTESRAGD